MILGVAVSTALFALNFGQLLSRPNLSSLLGCVFALAGLFTLAFKV